MAEKCERSDERNAVILMLATLLSRFLGILKTRVISVNFGAGITADAMNFAYNIPNNLRKIFAEGSLSSASLPVFSAIKDDRKRTTELYCQLVSLLILIFAALFLLSVFLSGPVIGFLSDFPDGEGRQIASSLLPYFTLFLFFISIAVLSANVLNSSHRFVAGAFAPAVFTLVLLLSLEFLSRSLRHYAMAFGTCAGAAAQFIVVAAGLRRLGIRFRPDFRFSSPDFRKTASGWMVSSISSIVIIVSQTVSMYLASSLPSGSVTALSNAIVFYSAPYGIFTSSITSVYFPMLSQTEDEKARARVLSKSLTYLVTFLLPSAIALSALSRDCVACILQNGAFTLSDTILTARVLDAYLAAMIFMAFYAMLQRCMYSRSLYRLTLAVSVLVSICDIAATVIQLKAGRGVEALAVSSAVSSLAGAAVLFCFVKGFDWKTFIKDTAKVLAANIPLFLLAAGYKIWNPQYYAAGSTLFNLGFTAAAGCAAVIVTLVSYAAFRVDFLSALRRKRP